MMCTNKDSIQTKAINDNIWRVNIPESYKKNMRFKNLTVVIPIYKIPLNYVTECLESLKSQMENIEEIIFIREKNDTEIEIMLEPMLTDRSE